MLSCNGRGNLFLHNPKKKPEVNRKDKNRYNNKVENLEWITSKENAFHSHKNSNPDRYSNSRAVKIIRFRWKLDQRIHRCKRDVKTDRIPSIKYFLCVFEVLITVSKNLDLSMSIKMYQKQNFRKIYLKKETVKTVRYVYRGSR